MTSCVYLSLSFVDQYNVMGKNIFFWKFFSQEGLNFFLKLDLERNMWIWSFIGPARRDGFVHLFLGGCNSTREMHLILLGLQ